MFWVSFMVFDAPFLLDMRISLTPKGVDALSIVCSNAELDARIYIDRYKKE